MRAIIILLTILITTSIAKADCLACWELRKVKIVLTNGTTKIGFVFWNESWMDETVKNWKELQGKFPENFIAYTRSRPEQQFYFLTKVTTVKNDSLSEFKAITKKDQQILGIKDVLKMTEIDKGSEKYQGAGQISIYSAAELKQLNTNPYATYLDRGSVCDTYFLSYNKTITRQQLKKISENNKVTPEELIKMGVVTITIGYD